MNLQEAYGELELTYYTDKYLTLKEVEKIYKKLARQYHPDMNVNMPEYLQKLAEQKFKKINEAMEIIRVELKKNEEKLKEELRKKELYTKGLNYYREKNYMEALKYFQKAGELGEINSQFYLGVFYDFGYVVKRNYPEAFKWYQKASKKGDLNAYESLKSLKKSPRYFLKKVSDFFGM